jgi:ribosomal protein S18 acetylase RimI-like enzyme
MTTIRRLGPDDDLGDLIALSRDFFQEYATHHDEFFQIDELHEKDIVDYFARSLNTEDCATFIAVLNGRIVGYITLFVRQHPPFFKIAKYGAISGLMVHKDHRRQGIASRLLAEATAFFQQKGVKYFTVYTAVANHAAVKFYERHGMTPLHINMIGETPNRTDAL